MSLSRRHAVDNDFAWEYFWRAKRQPVCESSDNASEAILAGTDDHWDAVRYNEGETYLPPIYTPGVSRLRQSKAHTHHMPCSIFFKRTCPLPPARSGLVFSPRKYREMLLWGGTKAFTRVTRKKDVPGASTNYVVLRLIILQSKQKVLSWLQAGITIISMRNMGSLIIG